MNSYETENRFIVVWDCNGLESIFDVNKELKAREDWEKQQIFDVLNEVSSGVYQTTIPLQMLLLRAKANMQRSYEIYEFNTTMSMEDVQDIFSNSPQIIVDWIRENGNKIHSDYVGANQKVIV